MTTLRDAQLYVTLRVMIDDALYSYSQNFRLVVVVALGRLLESAVPRTAQDVANERARENYQRMIVRQEENLGMHAVDPAAVELRRDEEWCAAEVRDSAPRSIL